MLQDQRSVEGANDRGGVSLTAPEGRGGERLVEDIVATLWSGGGVVGVQFGEATQFQGSWRDFSRLRTVLLDRKTGEILWSFPTGGRGPSPPSIQARLRVRLPRAGGVSTLPAPS